ncbi:hypothetical protein C8J57DRAFT_1250969 [Mycena rebaudengoi]|nr:hypothetical protein C8J57DRAFT_1250969 [Mycena rebaudengoi]
MLSVQSSVTHLPPSLLRDNATVNESDQRRDEISGHEKTSDSQRRRYKWTLSRTELILRPYSPQIGREAEPSSDPQTGRTLTSKLWGPAGIDILGQLIFQAAAWGFFAAIWRRGLISVPSFNFDVVDSFQIIHWAYTQISTGLAGCSSFLFSWAIQQSITLHLRREGMTFATFFWSMQISSRSRIWELKHLKWTVLSIAPGVSTEGYTLIFVGSGLYDFVKTTVCTFAPKITNVWADYSYEQISDTITTATLPGGIPDIKGPAAISAVMTIHNMLSFSQAVAANIVGDQLIAVLTEVASDQSDIMFRDDLMLAQEEYIRGVTEYSGTVFRACVSVKNGTFLDGVPKIMTIPIQGTLHTQFYGRKFTASTSWVLVPGTIFAIGSIWVLLLTVARHAGDVEGRKFNPADTMQLFAAAAAAAGGLKNVFHGTDEDAITKAENARIAIGAFQDQELALIVKRP